jgi:hypothetical protein
MSEAKLNLSVGGMDQERVSDKDRRPQWKKRMSRATAERLIREKGYNQDVTELLVQKLYRQPDNTYERFLLNIGAHLNSVQDKRNQ